MLSTWFPEGVPGYDTAPGVTIGSRLHPEQMPLGLRAGAFQVWPRLDESVGCTSNVLSGTRRQGSWQIVTEPTLAINSDWSRNAFGAVLSAQNMRYLSVPSQDWTNATLGNAIIQGIPSDQSYRDRLVGQGAVTLRYEWAPLRNLLFVVRALGQDYLQVPPGQPTPNSASYQVLGGLDTDSAVWRWRVLIGGEVRQFTSPVYPQQNTLIAEAGVTWSPTGMTSLGFTLDRETADAAQEGISGLTYTAARLSIDHEILRNLVFKASVALQQADFFQGGYQRGSTAGAGLTWVLNRSLRLSFTYDQTDLLPAHGNSAPGYSGGLGLVTVRLGL
jgi:hypothetical protein